MEVYMNTNTITRRNEWLNKLSKISGDHLYMETVNFQGNSSIDFYKFNGDRLVGPFNCTEYYTIGNEQYDKIINLINHGTDEEIRDNDEELVKLVKGGLRPGMPYIVLDGEGYVLIEKVFNEPESDSEVRAWGELSDDELKDWSDIVDNFRSREVSGDL
jgi:hypothetical protein